MPDDFKPHDSPTRDDLWVEKEPDTSTNSRPLQDTDPDTSHPSQSAYAYEAVGAENDTAASVAAGNSESPLPASTAPSKKSFKNYKKTIFTISASLLVLLSAGSVLAYNLWYQNQNKILGDALVNALSAESFTYNGSYTTEIGDVPLSINFDGNNPSWTRGQLEVAATLTAQERTFNLTSSSIMDKDGTAYVKLHKAQEFFDSVAPQLGVEEDTFVGLVSKIDDKWIKLPPMQAGQASGSAEQTQACLTDAFNTLRTDGSQQKELAVVYRQHQFISVENELGIESINGIRSFGYALGYDSDVFKQFADKADTTQFATALKACDASFSFALFYDTYAGLDDGTAPAAKVWISQWGHEITRFAVSDIDKSILTINPDFNAYGSTIAIPSDVVTLAELQDELANTFAPVLSFSFDAPSPSDARMLADAQLVIKYSEAFNATNATYPTLEQMRSGSLSSMPISSDILGRIGDTIPTEATPIAIQYAPCSGLVGGAVVRYYDSVTRTVETLTAGSCAG